MTKKDFTSLGGVVAAGMAGGIGFWLLGVWANTPMFQSFNPVGRVAALMFIGAIAALIGVYMLTASDLTSMRTYVFALVCGLVWQPITDAGKRLVANAAVSSKVAQVNSSTNDLANADRSGSQVDDKITNSVPGVKAALQAGSGVQDANKQDEILKSSISAVEAIQNASSKAPDASLKALSDISLEASHTGQSELAVRAIQGLRAIAFTAAEAKNDKLAAEATRSLQGISQQSRNAVVKAAAENTASSIQIKMKQVQ
jgi:hypothetical protein